MINFGEVKDTMILGLKRCGNIVKDHSPELMLFGSGVLLIYGVKECCKATPKYLEEKEKHEKVLEGIRIMRDNGSYDEQKEAVTMASEYASFAGITVKTYIKGGMAVACAFGIACGAVGVLKAENKKLNEQLVTLGAGLLAYRGRVAEYVGEEKEYDLFHNIKRKMIEEEYTDDKGKKKTRMVEEVDDSEAIDDIDGNSFKFDSQNRLYKDMTSNVYLIEETEKMFNKMLRGRGNGGVVDREEILRFFHIKDGNRAASRKFGAVYEEDLINEYDYPYEDDPYVPRIIKFTTSRDFGVTRGDTIVDMNLKPIEPVLKRIDEREKAKGKGSKYIATIGV